MPIAIAWSTPGAALLAAVAAGQRHHYAPFAGHSSGLIGEDLPAPTIVRRTVEQAESILARLSGAGALSRAASG
jgi:hypothetical protein